MDKCKQGNKNRRSLYRTPPKQPSRLFTFVMLLFFVVFLCITVFVQNIFFTDFRLFFNRFSKQSSYWKGIQITFLIAEHSQYKLLPLDGEKFIFIKNASKHPVFANIMNSYVRQKYSPKDFVQNCQTSFGRILQI